MGDSQYGTFSKFGGNDFLNQLIIFLINVRSGLVNQDYPAVFQESSAYAQKLFFSYRKAIIRYVAL